MKPNASASSTTSSPGASPASEPGDGPMTAPALRERIAQLLEAIRAQRDTQRLQQWDAQYHPEDPR